MAAVFPLQANQWPWVGFIRSFFPALRGRQLPFAVGTGFLVAPDRVLTAGHVVYDRQYGGFPDLIDITLAGSGTIAGQALTTQQWIDQDSATSNPVSAFDIATIRLNANAQATPVAIGRGTEVSGASVTAVGFTGSNYPNVPFYGGTTVMMPSQYDPYRIAYPLETVGGMSGGPVYTVNASNTPVVLGVHTSYFQGHGDGLRFTQPILDLIRLWMKS